MANERNPADVMRHFDMPFLGGPSGSVMDRIISAIAMKWEDFEMRSIGEKSDRNDETGRNQLSDQYDVGGIAAIETIALVGAGHHSLGELLLGAHAVVRALENIDSHPNQHFAEFCKQHGFVQSLGERGFNSEELRTLYDTMQSWPADLDTAHTTRATIYRDAICKFITDWFRHRRQGIAFAICGGQPSDAKDVQLAARCSAEYMFPTKIKLKNWWMAKVGVAPPKPTKRKNRR
eukprot:gnl/TRDRNA2_/TRDRNA2_128825_c2_seq1.p1 gnl/TRDRNA2_/TRDRNA2_128825_c2~~gnl/TRDRNA2_/TRDRNA2_128825_c2_seq1.p1  ORF type:complete len:260 (+),score=32.71 gnl/TRDRNA2_/TRDRNA2_128825_c2_seq1:81-782(+)